MQLNKIAAFAAAGILLQSAAQAETVIEVNPAIPAAKLNGKAKPIAVPPSSAAPPAPAPVKKRARAAKNAPSAAPVKTAPAKAAPAVSGSLPPPAPLDRNAAKADSRLKEVRKRIQTAQKDLKIKQSQQQRARQVISETEAALNKARQELAELNRQQRVSWGKLQSLQNRLTQLQTEVSGTKAQVARLLLGNYKNPQPEAVVLFLQNADTAQKGRLLQYSRYISETNDKVLKQLAEQQKQLAQQEAAVNAELARLKRLAAAQQEKLRKLGNSHHAALADSRKLAAEIGRQSSQLSELRQNERNLNGLLAQIHARRAAQQRAEAGARQKAARQRAEAARKGKKAPAAPAVAAATPKGGAGFGRLQGQLPRPVSGSVAGRFGQARSGGGAWRGVFFATAPSAVQSVAAGEVAYAADLRGYGKTVIIDHGDGYLSIYTGLGGVSVSPGSRVAARQGIGTSGSLPAGEQGLYFEIRYRNKAMNPLAWLR